MRATHWIPARHPAMAQAIASIVLNFGSLEGRLNALLQQLQDCPPNKRTAPKHGLSDTLKAIKSTASAAFGTSPLATRLIDVSDAVASLSSRRNILVHGETMKTSDGGLVVIHTRTNPRERIAYSVSLADVVALDNEITLANIDLERFSLGIDGPAPSPSSSNSRLLADLRAAMAPKGPPEIIPFRKAAFPSAKHP